MLTKSYYIYILTNQRNTVLYIGITNNIKRRIWEHKEKIVKVSIILTSLFIMNYLIPL
jgi:putative endonuclease